MSPIIFFQIICPFHLLLPRGLKGIYPPSFYFNFFSIIYFLIYLLVLCKLLCFAFSFSFSQGQEADLNPVLGRATKFISAALLLVVLFTALSKGLGASGVPLAVPIPLSAKGCRGCARLAA